MSVSITLDKPRDLKFDLRAVRDLEASMGGIPLAAIVNQMVQIGVTAICAGLWAGLKHEDKALTLNLTTKLLEDYIQRGGSLRKLGKALNDALDETGLFRTEEEDAANEDEEGNAKPGPVALGH